MRNAQREAEAVRAAAHVTEHLRGLGREPASQPIGLVLGTGWGDVLKFDQAIEIPFGEIPGFNGLEGLEGHARRLVIGSLGGRDIVALRGRVHLNEAPCDPNVAKMVRLQTEMLLQLGVRTLIVTSAVGSLRGCLPVGGIAVVDGFVTVYAPEMPMWAGEFVSPEDTLDPALRAIALEECGDLVAKTVGHVMVRGPFFEGRRYDKARLAGPTLPLAALVRCAGVVGMSMLPEACIAALYDAKVLGLGFVTNDDVAEHSHEENQRQAKAAAPHLCGLLARIVARL
ncbi:hypothetical protein HY635_00530 [Candidatus Uhrbacteria bacterium]|nr:hypothetical protein [Candidatus Uhrbacteria bacterium]